MYNFSYTLFCGLKVIPVPETFIITSVHAGLQPAPDFFRYGSLSLDGSLLSLPLFPVSYLSDVGAGSIFVMLVRRP